MTRLCVHDEPWDKENDHRTFEDVFLLDNGQAVIAKWKGRLVEKAKSRIGFIEDCDIEKKALECLVAAQKISARPLSPCSKIK